MALRSRLPVSHPQISPVGEGDRPFWSVMIPARNRAGYLEETLRSVLAEDPGPRAMQIEVVDDASTEDLRSVVDEVGGGRISYLRHSDSRGLAGNFNSCITRARGRWVHILHDDDRVLPGFYARAQALIDARPDLLLVFQKAIAVDMATRQQHDLGCHLDSTGVVPDAPRALAERNFVCCPTAVVARSAYEQLGGFETDLADSNDWELWQRLSAACPIAYVHEPGLLYRLHESSATNTNNASGALMRGIAETIERGIALLPEGERAEARARARSNYSLEASVTRARFERRGMMRPALRNALWGFRFRPTPANLARLVATPLRTVLVQARRTAA